MMRSLTMVFALVALIGVGMSFYPGGAAAGPPADLQRLPSIDSPRELAEPAPPALESDEIEIPLSINVPTTVPWYHPDAWLATHLWQASTELGLNGLEGNSQVFNIRVGAELARETDDDRLVLDATYLKNTTRGVETANAALANLHYEIFLGETPWSLFAKGSLEYDEFRVFDLRLAANGGVGYALIDTDAISLVGRFGAGVSHEIDSPDASYIPEAVFGGDFEYQLTKRQKFSVTADYFPDSENFDQYRINSDAGWELLLDDEMHLSLKVAAIDRYDSTPNGRKHNDLDYSLLLIWKP